MKTPLQLILFAISASLCLAEEASPNLDDPATLEKILNEALEKSAVETRGNEGEQIIYVQGSETPYTGWVKKMQPNGQVGGVIHLKDGKAHGLTTRWYEDGQKMMQMNYKDGKAHGITTMWYVNGKKHMEIAYKDGMPHGTLN